MMRMTHALLTGAGAYLFHICRYAGVWGVAKETTLHLVAYVMVCKGA